MSACFLFKEVALKAGYCSCDANGAPEFFTEVSAGCESISVRFPGHDTRDSVGVVSFLEKLLSSTNNSVKILTIKTVSIYVNLR